MPRPKNSDLGKPVKTINECRPPVVYGRGCGELVPFGKMREHYKSCSIADGLTCKLCMKKFKTYMQKHKHQQVEHRLEVWKCLVCEKVHVVKLKAK